MARLPYAALLALSLAVSCSSPDPSCTLIGALSGVRFDIDAWTAEHPTATTAEACVPETCQTVTVSQPVLLFVETKLQGPGPLPITLTVRDAQERVLFEGRTAVLLQKSTPNGPQCEPTVWQATVAPGAAGQLVTR